MLVVQELQTTFEQCVHSESNGGKLAKCYKSDSKACAVVKMYNKDPVGDTFFLKSSCFHCPLKTYPA